MENPAKPQIRDDFPGLNIGEEITNEELTSIFKISLRSGMNRSKRTNSLVLISNHTRDYYDDVWKNDVLHYTGMGLTGDQKLTFKQNKTLNASNTNGVKVYLFEVFTKGRYRIMVK